MMRLLKKSTVWLIIALTVFVCLPASAAHKYRVFERNATMIVPLRYVSEWLGAKLTPGKRAGELVIEYDNISVAIFKNKIYKGEKEVKLPTPPFVENGDTYVPVQLFTIVFLVSAKKDPLKRDEIEYGKPLSQLVLSHPKLPDTLVLPINSGKMPQYDAIHFDAYSGSIRLAILHLEKGKVDIGNSAGYSPLHLAARQGQFEMVKWLIANGANIKLRSSDYRATPLSFAAITGNPELITLLLEKGADVNDADVFGRTPIMVAAVNGYGNIVEKFIDSGAKCDIKDRDLMSLLHWAALSSDLQTLSIVLKQGIDINSKDALGFTPLMCAVVGSSLSGTRVNPVNKDSVELLIEKGADVNCQSQVSGVSVLHWAVLITARSGNNLDVVSALVTHKANVNCKERDGNTPLAMVCNDINKVGTKAVIEWLIANGAAVNTQNNDGDTPLHLAASYDNDVAVSILLANHADVNVKNKEGKTPLAYAPSDKMRELIRLQGGTE